MAYVASYMRPTWLVYRVSSRTDRVTQRNPVLKQTNKQTNKQTKKRKEKKDCPFKGICFVTCKAKSIDFFVASSF
jgi:radical SAM protein with 4Fe4S-binding SPASM domain